jgi:hypothetical protein
MKKKKGEKGRHNILRTMANKKGFERGLWLRKKEPL